MQVSLACAAPSWPLLQLVSSGCHSAMSTLQARLQRLFVPVAHHKSGHSICPPMAAPLFAYNILAKPQLCKDMSTPLRCPGPGRDSSKNSWIVQRYHTLDNFAGSQKAVRGRTGSESVTTAFEHQYPVQFMIAVANTARTIHQVLCWLRLKKAN